MAEITSFDAIIVGAGQAGKPLALDLAGRGWSVALVAPFRCSAKARRVRPEASM